MKRTIFGYLMAMSMMLATSGAYATFIQGDFATTADGLLTLDDTTDLEWLNIGLTEGQSYNSIANGYGDYTTLHGFRFATETEFLSLFGSQGIAQGTHLFDGAPVPASIVAATIQLLGPTDAFFHSSLGNIVAIHAYLETGVADLAADTIQRAYMVAATDIGGWELANYPLNWSPDSQIGNVGGLLVRSSRVVVPAPATLLLIGAGCIAFIGARKRKLTL